MAFALLPQTAVAQAPPEEAEEVPTEESGPACPQEAPELTFSDRARIPAAHEPNVRCAVAVGIVSGFPDGTYGPDLPVRRDQMAAFIALTLDAAGIDLPDGADGTFSDVPATNTHARHVNRLAAAGIVQGGPGGLSADQYGPGMRTRRDQMASFLMRAAGYALQNDVDAFNDLEQRFTDVPSSNAHFAKVNAAAAEGLAGGIGEGLYAPGRETRRDQLASFVVRLLHYASSLDITLAPSSGAPGTQVSGTINDDVDAVEGVSISGPCVEDVADLTPTEGSFDFTISREAAQGQCTITFAVTFNDGSGPRTATRPFEVLEAPPTPAVDISLASDQGWPGSLVLATVSGETHRVREVAASGACIEDRSGAPDEDRIEFLIAEGAAAGACEIAFTVSFVDGSPTETITRSVTVGPPPEVSITLATSSGPPGTQVTGTVEGDLDKVQRLGVSGACLDDASDLALSDGGFAFPIRAGATEGPCELTFTIAYIDGATLQSITRTFQVGVAATLVITTSPLPGRHVTGTVAGDRSGVAEIRVSGPCIPSTGYLLTLTPNGAFDFPVAPGTGPMDCQLTFAISLTGGGSQTVARTYPVNARTGGPNLLRAVADPGRDQVVYHFDGAVQPASESQCPLYPGEDTGRSRFSVIDDKTDPDGRPGVRRHPTDVRQGTESTAIVATFRSGVIASARLAAIRHGAVIGGGRCGYPSNAALPGLGDGTTPRPDLLRVRSTGGGATVHYTFDRRVDDATDNRYAALYNSELFIVDSSNQMLRARDEGDGGCSKQYTTTNVSRDTISVTNCYPTDRVGSAVLGVTQPMPPHPDKDFGICGPRPCDYQDVNQDGITPSHPEGAATLRRG